MVYAVYTTKRFDDNLNKLPKDYIDNIKGIFLHLRENPYVGDQLRYRHLREKRIKEKRIYYLVYPDLKSVLLVAISSKKDQKATINHIIYMFDEYNKYLRELLKRN